MPYKPKTDPSDYSDPPADPDRFARLQVEWIEQHGYKEIFEMNSLEQARQIGECIYCGCPLYEAVFMGHSSEGKFWGKGYPDCVHCPDDRDGEKACESEG